MPYIPSENLHLPREALIDFPRPDTLASEQLAGWLRDRGIELAPADIDVVTLHYQYEPLGEGRQHFRENAIVTQKMSLVEALLGNWQGEPSEGYGNFHFGDWAGLAPQGAVTLVERLEPQSALSNASAYLIFNGLYRRTSPQVYGPQTKLAVRAEDFQGFIWGLHFHHLYRASLDRFWEARLAHYQRALKISFIAACNRQVLEGSLSDQGQRLAWQAAGLRRSKVPALQRRMLNVYGYTSTSILCLTDADSGFTLLYLPGNASPLHEFSDQAAMQQWFAEQCQDPAKRVALERYFTPADWPDGLDYSGLRTALKGLGLYPKPHRLAVNHDGFATSGFWVAQEMVNYRAQTYSPLIIGDLFAYLAERQKQRSYEDADSQITSNHQIDKARWTSYLNAAMVIISPLAMVVPELIPVLLTGGLSQFALGMDQLLNGKTLEEKSSAVSTQVFGLLNALPLAATLAADPAQVYRWYRPGFVTPSRLRDLLSAGSPAASPAEEIELAPAESAFREAPVIPSSQISALATRIDANLHVRFLGWFEEDGKVTGKWMEYELASDSFIKLEEARLAEPPRWIVSNRSTLVRLADLSHPVSDVQRMATLRALGIHVHLPIELGAYDALATTAIPQIISSLWVGDRAIGPTFLEALAHNAQALSASDYRYQLFLSRLNPDAYQHNLALLAERAPTLVVLPLEQQPFFQAFTTSRYFSQYQAAIDGNGGVATNFSSACDILRYRLLSHLGGIYLDADDQLLLAARPERDPLPLLRQPLKTSADGLLLAPPVSNDQMGMYIKFNSSVIGSHPGNPTLQAISDEILRRYQLEPTFYSRRPFRADNSASLAAYSRRLSLLTGPGVLNDVIDQRLPWLSQLREICNLLVAPLHDVHRAINLRRFSQTLHEHVPMDQCFQMGQAHSWWDH